MRRTDVINHLIKKFGYKSYLEIGLWDSANNFDLIQCEHKDNIDPDPRWNAKYQMTSDEFFANSIKQKYDLIFIDGDHSTEAVLKDLMNSLKWMTDNGTVVLHDSGGNRNVSKAEWESTYDGPKAICIFNTMKNDFQCHVVDTDNGCGIVRHGKQEKTKLSTEEAVKWENRVLHYISVDEFLVM